MSGAIAIALCAAVMIGGLQLYGRIRRALFKRRLRRELAEMGFPPHIVEHALRRTFVE